MSNPSDKRVLNAILNPNTPFDDDEETKTDEAKSKYVVDEAISEAKQLEAKGVKEAEANNLDRSIELFSAAIEKAPHWASSYNNRAQANRLKSNMKDDKLTLEQLNESHRKQRKDLQAKVQGLKKSVTKGDKKRKKEIDAEIERLEKELDEKCQLELKQFKEAASKSAAINTSAGKEEVAAVVSGDDQESIPKTSQEGQKISKAQKRREKKEKSEAEREVEIAKQEVENKKGPAAIELRKIKEKLSAKGLVVKEVKSDGNCMYYAVSDQLEQKMSMIKSCEELRDACATHMLAHPDDFMPYLDDVEFDADKYREYCERVRDVTNWGGQLELKALSDTLGGLMIEVVQAEGGELVIGHGTSSSEQQRLVITYHRHMYGSGEHYNSTQPQPRDAENKIQL